MFNQKVSHDKENENKFDKREKSIKKPLGGLQTNTGAIKKYKLAPGLSRTPRVQNKEKSTRGNDKSRDLKHLCEKEIDQIFHMTVNELDIRPPDRPKSANCIHDVKHFKFDILEDSQIKNVASKRQKSTNDVQILTNTKEEKVNRESGQINKKTDKGMSSAVKNVQLDTVKKLEHHQKTQKALSPIPANAFGILFPDLIYHKPKVSKRHTAQDPVEISYKGDIFNEEYLNDMIKISKQEERKFLLPNHFLRKYNPREVLRRALVGWMLNVQYMFKLKDDEFYLSVSLLDQVLYRITVPREMYPLVGSACILIANKVVGVDDLGVHHLHVLCLNRAYHTNHLIKMERKILKLLEFRIHTIEPSVYINYYLKIMKLYSKLDSYFTIFFVLDCFVHFVEYSSTPVSIVAASAILVAFKLFHKHQVDTIRDFFIQNLSLEEIMQCKSCQQFITNHINKLEEYKIFPVIMNKYKHFNWFCKDSTSEVL